MVAQAVPPIRTWRPYLISVVFNVSVAAERRRPRRLARRRLACVLAGWRAGVSPAFPRGGEDAASPAAETAALLFDQRRLQRQRCRHGRAVRREVEGAALGVHEVRGGVAFASRVAAARRRGASSRFMHAW